MASFNKVILVGNLTQDPELKKTNSGVSVCSFRIAVGRRFAKDGQPETDFFDIVTWRNTAEFVCRYFRKGKPILVCGELQNRSWTDKDGSKRYVTEIVADECTFVENKTATQVNTEGETVQAPTYQGEQTGFEDLSSDDELPF